MHIVACHIWWVYNQYECTYEYSYFNYEKAVIHESHLKVLYQVWVPICLSILASVKTLIHTKDSRRASVQCRRVSIKCVSHTHYYVSSHLLCVTTIQFTCKSFPLCECADNYSTVHSYQNIIHVVTFDCFLISVNANDSSTIHCEQNIIRISKLWIVCPRYQWTILVQMTTS